MSTRADTGGYEARFIIERADGQPIDPARRYMVLSFDGSDPEAVQALRHYAFLKLDKNPNLTSDLIRYLDNPDAAPAQHRYAK